MANGRKKMAGNKKTPSREDKMRRLDKHYSEWTGGEITTRHAYLQFTIHRRENGNSPQTIAFYDRFYKKLCNFIETYLIYNDPIEYADLILGGNLEAYLKAVTEYKMLD